MIGEVLKSLHYSHERERDSFFAIMKAIMLIKLQLDKGGERIYMESG